MDGAGGRDPRGSREPALATLIVTPFTPREGVGRGLRTVTVARALARNDDVEVAYVEFDGTDPSPALQAEPRVTLRRLVAGRGLRRALTYGRARLAGTPPGFARGLSRELVEAARPGAQFDRVVADLGIAAAAFLLQRDGQPFVYNAHNLESSFRSGLAGARRHYGSPERFRAWERKVLARAAETWLPTRRDIRDAAELAPGAALRYVPNVVDVAAIRPVSPAGTGRVLFVGDFTYEPNRNAARFLVEDVMPRVWASTPDARLAVVGRSPALPPGLDRRIDVLGFVDDLGAEYSRSDCAVVPLLQGGGSPLKFVEALAYGLPVVATSLAASGLESAVAGEHYVEADGAAQFSDALLRVLSGGAGELGHGGRALAEREFSIEALAALLAPG